jgi:hypothetical protein
VRATDWLTDELNKFEGADFLVDSVTAARGVGLSIGEFLKLADVGLAPRPIDVHGAWCWSATALEDWSAEQ